VTRNRERINFSKNRGGDAEGQVREGNAHGASSGKEELGLSRQEKSLRGRKTIEKGKEGSGSLR